MRMKVKLRARVNARMKMRDAAPLACGGVRRSMKARASDAPVLRGVSKKLDQTVHAQGGTALRRAESQP